jgi:hypothetical protein
MDPGYIQNWEEIAGNASYVATLKNILRKAKTKEPFRLNTLLLGDSRQGKTSILEFFLRCLHCRDLCLKTLNPQCKPICNTCLDTFIRYGITDIHRPGGSVHSYVIDCTTATAADIQKAFYDVRDSGEIRVMVLDELGRLADRVVGQTLLHCLEEPGMLWFATAISAKHFETALLRRFTRLTAEPPTPEELTTWTCQRMNRQGIKADKRSTIPTLIHKANGSPGLIVEVLRAVEIKPDRTLTETEIRTLSCTN